MNIPQLSSDLLALAAYTLDHLEPVPHDEKSRSSPPNQAVLIFLPGKVVFGPKYYFHSYDQSLITYFSIVCKYCK